MNAGQDGNTSGSIGDDREGLLSTRGPQILEGSGTWLMALRGRGSGGATLETGHRSVVTFLRSLPCGRNAPCRLRPSPAGSSIRIPAAPRRPPRKARSSSRTGQASPCAAQHRGVSAYHRPTSEHRGPAGDARPPGYRTGAATPCRTGKASKTSPDASSLIRTSFPNYARSDTAKLTRTSPPGLKHSTRRRCLSPLSPIMNLKSGSCWPNAANPRQGAIFRVWLETLVLPAFSDRILSVDAAVARCAATLHVPDPRPIP